MTTGRINQITALTQLRYHSDGTVDAYCIHTTHWRERLGGSAFDGVDPPNPCSFTLCRDFLSTSTLSLPPQCDVPAKAYHTARAGDLLPQEKDPARGRP